jgi:hypothetical protein
VLITDLPPVLGLMRANAADAAAAGHLAPGSTVVADSLPWGHDVCIPPPKNGAGTVAAGTVAAGTVGGGVGGGGGGAGPRCWDIVLGCEILYWGGWDIFDEDTRGPLLATLRAACAPPPHTDTNTDTDDAPSVCSSSQTEVALAFTVRDKGRETGFLLDEIGGAFWLRLLGDNQDGGGGGEEVLAEEEEEEGTRVRRLDAAARAAVAAAAEGDLLLLGGRLK